MPKSKARKPKNTGPTKPKNKTPKKQADRTRIGEQIQSLQGTVLNLRQMYDQAILEKQGLESQIRQRDRLLVALAVEYGGRLETDETLFSSVQREYEGYEIRREDGVIYIDAVALPDDEDEDE